MRLYEVAYTFTTADGRTVRRQVREFGADGSDAIARVVKSMGEWAREHLVSHAALAVEPAIYGGAS